MTMLELADNPFIAWRDDAFSFHAVVEWTAVNTKPQQEKVACLSRSSISCRWSSGRHRRAADGAVTCLFLSSNLLFMDGDRERWALRRVRSFGPPHESSYLRTAEFAARASHRSSPR
jgi:hypothetical protein